MITPGEALFLCDFRYTEQAEGQVAGFDIEEVTGSLPARTGERLAHVNAGTAVYDPGVLSVAELHEIQAAFAGTLTPDPDIVSALRRIKSPEEIAAIRRASSLAEGVLADLLEELDTGLPERELAARFRLRGAWLLNDLEALAHALPALGSRDLAVLTPGADDGCVTSRTATV